ncbi:carboxymuconolactone decarboxylase family protein [Agromyces marinus]|uniref:Carboxymuconolactone decarboxylase-like domain-containing protein n=1 Tax=Agromyces marinus TaxID=1389020 RepID=A0ABN6YFZ6_9MICO|nr:carboxymuconolactone decarboxylase family protein [Agromyces marinus]UIP60029.1 hypothetical protein DSM26151_29440 [Agromyces marinus]BDZ54860.1 hypothetical protein GCM10025870_19330 [Agromyces marinus]
MEPVERLRRLAVDGEHSRSLAPRSLDGRSLALSRIAALIAVGGPEASFGSEVDAAISEGATAEEIVDVLAGVIPVAGMPRAVAAAPKLALALGYDDLLEAD